MRTEQASAYATPAALTAGFNWYRAFDGDVRDNQAFASGPAAATPLLYLRGGASGAPRLVPMPTVSGARASRRPGQA